MKHPKDWRILFPRGIQEDTREQIEQSLFHQQWKMPRRKWSTRFSYTKWKLLTTWPLLILKEKEIIRSTGNHIILSSWWQPRWAWHKPVQAGCVQHVVLRSLNQNQPGPTSQSLWGLWFCIANKSLGSSEGSPRFENHWCGWLPWNSPTFTAFNCHLYRFRQRTVFSMMPDVANKMTST